MRFMDELKRLAKPFSEDSEDFDNYDDGLNDETPNIPPASKASVAPAYDMNDLGLGSATATVNNDTRSNKVVSIHPTVQMQVILVKPESFDTVTEIAEQLRAKHAVVLNLEKTDAAIARRLVDFLSGCAYALDGKIKKIAISTYLITPYNVDIIGDVIDQLENNGVYL